MVGARQNLIGSRDLTMPLSGIVCHPWASALATINLSIKFEVSVSIHYEERQAIQNSKNWVVWGHWK